MITEVGERIKVGVVFAGGTARPAWFVWRNRKYDVEEITYRWQERVGEITLSFFSCAHGADLYELVFNAKHLSWTLEKIASES